jgi:hypothetical protein
MLGMEVRSCSILVCSAIPANLGIFGAVVCSRRADIFLIHCNACACNFYLGPLMRFLRELLRIVQLCPIRRIIFDRMDIHQAIQDEFAAAYEVVVVQRTRCVPYDLHPPPLFWQAQHWRSLAYQAHPKQLVDRLFVAGPARVVPA